MLKAIDIAIKNIPRIESDSSVVDALELMLQSNTTTLFLYDAKTFKGPICRGNLSGYPLTRLLMDCPCSPFVSIKDNEPFSKIKDIFHEVGKKHIIVKDDSEEPLGLVETSFLLSNLFNPNSDISEAIRSDLIDTLYRSAENTQSVSNALDPFSDKINSLEKLAIAGQISTGIAHDANNLLTAIMGNTELALLEFNDSFSKKDPPHFNEYLETILSSVNQCIKLLRSFISISKPSNVSIPEEIVNVNEICLETISLLCSSIKYSSNISFSHRLNAYRPKISCSKSRVLNSLINLCLNARDALPSGGNIELATSNIILKEPYNNAYGFSITEGSYAIISISDNGKGIPHESLASIFEPYFTTKPTGTGLGLSNIRQIISELNGLIDVESTEGSGTTFKLYIPTVSDRSGI